MEYIQVPRPWNFKTSAVHRHPNKPWTPLTAHCWRCHPRQEEAQASPSLCRRMDAPPHFQSLFKHWEGNWNVKAVCPLRTWTPPTDQPRATRNPSNSGPNPLLLPRARLCFRAPHKHPSVRPPLPPFSQARQLTLVNTPAVIMSKPTSVNGSESEFEFIETPKFTPPSTEKEEDYGVRTTKVRGIRQPNAPHLTELRQRLTSSSLRPSKMPPCLLTGLAPTPSATPFCCPS